jgi:Nucleotidyl transferase AbiEii toxin, Type IV TA system
VTAVLSPRFEVLPSSQRRLWPELTGVARGFVLYGGTGLALRLGHRASVDFDFFAHDPLDHRKLERDFPRLRSAETVQEDANTRTALVNMGDGIVKVSFFGGIAFGRVGEPELTQDGVLRVASLLDLAGTKIKALLQRVEAKDYLDIAALLDAKVPLGQIFAAARALFGPAFNPLVAQKTLTYFEGGDLASLPAEVVRLLIRHAVGDVDVPSMVKLSERLD